RLWVATENGVSVIEGGRVTTWRTRDGLASNVVNGLGRGRQGGVWIATAAGLCSGTRLQVQGRPPSSVAALNVVVAGRDGRLWVGTERGLLSGDASLDAELACRGECFAQRSVTALMQDRDGGLWIGFADGDVVRRLDGVDTRYGAADGLPAAGRVEAVFQDE